MSEPKLISPMLDHFAMGDPISDHNGVRCCPAMRNDSDEKYIVKIISVPASKTQLDALLLTGAYPDEASALAYFKKLADSIIDEVDILSRLSQLEGFLPYTNHQITLMEDESGYDVYLLSTYKRTLARHFSRNPMTHLAAVNMGLDLCAALAVCRRSGYLYVDLKPTNIYITEEQEYRIGDIGFVKLDSLKYASLEDKYRSAYTAPEISDVFSSLNQTVDIYAAGLILYQAYNDGVLPFTGDSAPATAFSAPKNADSEMAEIILKACAPDPDDRWQDPVEMGQALVSYMQRNGVNDTPIEPVCDSMAGAESHAAAAVPAELESTEGLYEKSACEKAETNDSKNVELTVDTLQYTEDDYGNLAFLEDAFDVEPEAAYDSDAVSYHEVSDEVSVILSQADALAAHPVPDPVIAPDPVEIVLPEPMPVSDDAQAEEELPDTQEKPTDSTVTNTESAVSEAERPKRNNKLLKRWIAVIVSILLLLGLLAGGLYYYNNFYLQTIESVTTEGNKNGLVVYVTSQVDEKKLSVVCADDYGNQLVAPVSDGKAVFTNLVPNTGYNIYVQIEGFHKLIGQTTAAYSTPVQTSIVQFNAVAGSEDGSVILSFTLDGKDAGKWTIAYSAEGEESRTVEFLSHTVTLTGLTIGKEYTFTLIPDTDLFLTGTTQISFTASRLVYAQDLTVTGCANNKLSVTWSAPEGVNAGSWTVRCYNSSGYNETIITTETSAIFQILNDADSYTVEVIAGGMTVSQRVVVPANSVTVSGFRAEATDFQSLSLSWNTSQPIPQQGWMLYYTIEGSNSVWPVTCTKNAVLLTPVLPGCTYTFTLQTRDGTTLLSEPLVVTVPASPDFSGTFGGLSVSRENMTVSMCKTPSVKNWTYSDLKDSDYTTQFTKKQKASFLIKLNTSYGTDNTQIDVLFMIRNSDGDPLSSSLKSYRWSDMWNKHYCELDIPNLPTASGNYIVNVYFNGGLVAEQSFTILP